MTTRRSRLDARALRRRGLPERAGARSHLAEALEQRALPGSLLVTLPSILPESRDPALAATFATTSDTTIDWQSLCDERSSSQDFDESAAVRRSQPSQFNDRTSRSASVQPQLLKGPHRGGSSVHTPQISSNQLSYRDFLAIRVLAGIDEPDANETHRRFPGGLTGSATTGNDIGAGVVPSLRPLSAADVSANASGAGVAPRTLHHPSPGDGSTNNPSDAEFPASFAASAPMASSFVKDLDDIDLLSATPTADDFTPQPQADTNPADPGPHDAPQNCAQEVTLPIDSALPGWTVNQFGGTAPGLGAASATAGSVTLSEGNSFLTTLEHPVAVSQEGMTLSFVYDELSFDTSSTGRMKDAFEVALVGANGEKLVHSFAPDREAFANFSEGTPAGLAQGVSQTGSQVTLNLSDIFPGTTATLSFRLLNNDGDEGTFVRLRDVRLTSSGSDCASQASLSLLNDTAPTGPNAAPFQSDRFTNDPRVIGTVSADQGIVLVQIAMDGGSLQDITATVQNGQFTFDPGVLAAGPHSMLLRATDSVGQITEATLDFTVNALPVASAGGNRTVIEGSVVNFNASDSADTDAPLYSHQWTLDDGSTVAGPLATRTYPQQGQFTVNLLVTDTAGSTASAVATISVENAAPVMSPLTDQTIDEGTSVSLAVNFQDPGVLDLHTAIIDWGDGTVESAHLTELAGSGTVTTSHAYRENGDYTATLTVRDQDGGSNSQPFIVHVRNRAPIITAVNAPTGPEGSVIFLLASFTDQGVLDTHTATVNWSNGSTTPAMVTEANGQGTVAANHLYADDGVYPVSVTVFDDEGEFATRQLSATIINVAPVVPPIASQTIDEGGLASLVATFTDVGVLDLHSAVINWGDGTVEPASLTELAGLGTVTSSHTYHENGNYTAVLTVSDADGGSTSQPFVVDVRNRAPLITQLNSLSGQEGSPVTLIASFTDAGVLDTHAATVTWSDGLVTSGIITESAGQGTISASHTYADNSSYPVSLTLSDDDGDSVTQNLTATISNVPPVVTPAGNQTVGVGALLDLDIATFVDPGFTNVSAGTVETFAATIDWGDGSALEAGVVSVTQGAVGVLTRGTVQGTHTYSAGGHYTVTVTVDDDDQGRGSANFSVVVQAVAANPCAYIVPGVTGELMEVTFNWITRDATYNNELGVYPLDGDSGAVDGVPSNTSGYALAALTTEGQRIVFASGETAGAVTRMIVPAGTLWSPYVVQNSTTDLFLSRNPDNVLNRSPLAWFCFAGANPDGFDHFRRTDLPNGVVQYAVEDLTNGGDQDFNDLVFTITAAPAPVQEHAKFVVVDGKSDSAFRYGTTGAEGAESELDQQNNNPRGVTMTAAGDRYWVIDVNKRVYVYHADGSLRAAWRPRDLSRPEGIATDGHDLWLMDGARRRVLRYDGGASRTYGDPAASSSFKLHRDNARPTDMATDGQRIWVTDDSRNEVFVYSTNGQCLGRWKLDAKNADPAGITHEPGSGTNIWVADRVDDRVYKYSGGEAWTSGKRSAAGSFALASGNGSVEGIADPPHLAITSPTENEVVQVGLPTVVTGHATGADSVFLNGRPVDALDSNGQFFAQYLPAEGLNTLEVQAFRAGESIEMTSIDVMATSSGAELVVTDDDMVGVTPVYERTSFATTEQLTHVELAFQNSSASALRLPLRVGIANITEPTVQLRNASGRLPDGTPYLEVAATNADVDLAPGEVTALQDLVLYNPQRLPFSYQLVTLAHENSPPQFVTSPQVEAIIGKPYRYDVDALDTDGHAFSFALLTGPAGMSVDPLSGLITWSPSPIDTGNHHVRLLVTDALGAKSEQQFTLQAIQQPPNRPPFITSVPKVDGAVGVEYGYQLRAIDPDQDPLDFSLVQAPQGMTIDAQHGRISWQPTADQIGLHQITVRVNDGLGGDAEQVFSILVAGDPANHPPVIVTEPMPGTVVGGTYRYDVDAIDPDRDPLTYSLTDAPRGMSIDSASGVIDWERPGFGKALDLDGVDDFVQVPSHASLDLLEDYTISLWVKPATPGPDSFGPLIGKLDHQYYYTTSPYNLAIDNRESLGFNDALLWFLGDDGTNGVFFSVNNYFTGRYGSWVHVAAVMSGNDMLLYRDGELIATHIYSGTRVTNPVPLEFGRSLALLPTEYFIGALDEIQIWDRALNAQQINATRVTTVSASTSGVVGYWGLDEESGEIVENLAGAAPDGTLFGDPEGLDPSPRIASANPANQDVQGDRVVFYDGTFHDTDWDLTVFKHGNSVELLDEVAMSARQAGTADYDGVYPGRAGEYREVTRFTKGGTSDAASWVFGFHRRIGAVYDPSSQGAIFSIDYFEDFQTTRRVEPFGIALRQNGRIYTYYHFGGRRGGWERERLAGVHAKNFVLLDEDSPNAFRNEHPDFSAQGAPIEFGFMRFLALNYAPTNNDVNTSVIDNWSVSITPVRKYDFSVSVADGRGGFDSQSATIRLDDPSRLQGFAYHDLNSNGDRELAPYVFADHWGLRSIVRIDGASGRLIDEFSRNGYSFDIGPDGNIYVGRAGAESGTSIIERYDGRTGEFMGVFAAHPHLDYPHAMAFGPNGNLFVVGTVHKTLLEFDATSGAIVSEMPTYRSFPVSDIEFDQDGLIYLAVYSGPGGGGVYQYERRGDNALGEYKGADRTTNPTSLAFGPDGMLYVGSDYHTPFITRVDPASMIGEIIYTGARGWYNHLAFGPDGLLYVSEVLTGQILRIDTATGTLVDVFADLGAGSIQTIKFKDEHHPVPEQGQGGRVIYLDDNRNGRRDVGERSTVSDEHGYYSFENLAAGDFSVLQEPLPGWLQTQPNGEWIVTLDVDDVAYNLDFGSSLQDDVLENFPPTFSSAPPSAGVVGEPLSYAPSVQDPNGDTLTFELLVGPEGMAIDVERGRIAWKPGMAQVGGHDVILSVSDGRGGVDNQSFRIDVLPPNSAPVVTSEPPARAFVERPVEYRLSAQDAEADRLAFHLLSAPEGMGIAQATGVISWIPSAAQVGLRNVVVEVRDERGATAQHEFSLEVSESASNVAPVIRSTPRTTTLMGAPYAHQVEAGDADSDPLTYILMDGAPGMTLDALGVLRWVPTEGQLGSHHVHVRVEDGQGGVADQEFELTVVSELKNSAPLVTSSPALSATVGQVYRYNAAATDADNDSLGFFLTTAPLGMSVDPATGSMRWKPSPEQLGPHQVVLEVLDGHGGLTRQRFEILVRSVNTPPMIVSAAKTEAFRDNAYVYAVNALDAEGAELTYQLSAAPNGMTINPGTGVIHWTPNAAQIGVVSVVVTVTDAAGDSARQAFSLVTVDGAPNHAPSLQLAPHFRATVGVLYQEMAQADDPDGDAVEFRLLAHPSGMTIDPSSGELRWTPSAGDIGSHAVTVAAIDARGLGASQRYTLDVLAENRPPQFVSTPPTVITLGQTLQYDPRATDPDGESVQFGLTTSPTGTTINGRGRIRWTPTVADVGAHAFTLVATDERGASVSQQFQFEVLPDTTAPRVTLIIAEPVVNIGASASALVLATDDVGVDSIELTVGGVDVAVEASGQATLPTIAAGVYTVLARVKDVSGNVGTASTSFTVIDPNDVEAPVVVIESPEGDATVTGVVEVIGSVSDDNLLSYALELVDADGGVVQLAQGTAPVDHAVLGRLDTSRLRADSYLLRLSASDIGGNLSTIEQTVHVTADLKLGDFTLSFTDLTLSVSGVPITVTRTYDSQAADRAGDFGPGWRLEFRDVDLRTSVPNGELAEYLIYNPFRDGSRVYITVPGGKREAFTFHPRPAPGLKGSFFGIYEPYFEPAPGVHSELRVKSADLRLNEFGEAFDYLSAEPFNPSSPLFGGVYTLTTVDGLEFDINAQTGDLTTVSDPNANRLTFTDSAIESSTGKRVAFERNPQGRITAVIDPVGQRIEYRYNAAGDLVRVIDREGAETEFRYNAPRAHYLTEVIDPLGRTGVRSEYDAEGRLVRMVDAHGEAIRLVHDPDNSLETVYDQLNHPTIYEYDERGNVVHETTEVGGVTQVIERTYDLNNNMLTETDALGRTTHFTYDSRGNSTSETDPLGNTTFYTYQSFGGTAFTGPRFMRQRTVTDALGNTTTNDYDGSGNLLATIDPLGNATSFGYDGAGNLSSLTNSLGHATQFTYDGAGNVLTETDAEGNVTTNTYDLNGRRLTEKRRYTNAQGQLVDVVTRTEYDDEGRVTKVIDALGGETRTVYNAAGQEVERIDALGRVTKMVYDDRGQLLETIYPDTTLATDADNPRTLTEYDAKGQQTATIDELGRRTTMVYDETGRVRFTIYPDATPANPNDNPRTETVYDKVGQVLSQIDERGNRTEFRYDLAGRQIETILPDDTPGNLADNPRLRTEYDQAGRAVRSIDPLGHASRTEYDDAGRPTKRLFDDGSFTTTTLDDAGRLVAQTDQNGITIEYEYDRLGRLIAVVQPEVLDAASGLLKRPRTEYEYDELGNHVVQRDARGRETRYEYDPLGRRVATELPMGERSSIDYDVAGRVESTTDNNGDTITFAYDSRDRLITKTFEDDSSVSFTYTLNGQRETYTDARGITEWQYDERDRLIARIDPDGIGIIAYEYDAAGNRTRATTSTGPIQYTFDEQNRLETVTDPSGGLTRYFYDAAGRLERTEQPNGTVERREYDALNRPVLVEHANGAGVFASFTYELDATGNRTSITEQDGRRTQYDYDDLYRLVDERIFDATNGNRTIGYEYDLVSNRLARNDSLEGTTDYEYNANDELILELLAGDETRYAYDDNGNTLTKTKNGVLETEYAWDFENRLIAADTDGDGSFDVTNRYDADGIRVAQVVSGDETRFLIDSVQPYQQVVEEYTPGGIIKVSYVHGLDLVSQSRSGEQSIFHTDALGSTRALTNSTGLVTDRYLYDAFGRTIGQVGSTGNVYLFAGEQHDRALGLDYLRARWLAPANGRLFGRDSFPGNLASPATLNRFAYANANPTLLADPTGHFASLSEVSTALATQSSLTQAAMPTIAFGAVRLGLTLGITSALKEALGAYDTALTLMIEEDPAGVAQATFEASREAVGFYLRLLGSGLNGLQSVQDVFDATTSLADSAINLGSALTRLSTELKHAPALLEVTHLTSKVAYKVGGNFFIVEAGIPELIAIGSKIESIGSASALYHAAELVGATFELFGSLDTLASSMKEL